MKRSAVLFLFALSALQLFADKDVKFFMNSGEVKCIAQERVDSIVFDDAEEYAIVAFDGLTEQLELASIDSIKYGQLPQEVSVTYAGNSATVINPFAFDSVRVRITGAKVVVTIGKHSSPFPILTILNPASKTYPLNSMPCDLTVTGEGTLLLTLVSNI